METNQSQSKVSALGRQIIALLDATQLSENLKRGCVGMAGSVFRGTKPPETIAPGFEKRDALTQDIMAVVKDADPEIGHQALVEAREYLNAPYQNTLNAFNAHRAQTKSLLKREKKTDAKKR